MNRLWACLFTVVVFGTTVNAAPSDTINFMTREGVLETPVEQKVVEIHMKTKKTSAAEESKRKRKIEVLPFAAGTCSGSFIDDIGDILTARHCVEGFDLFEVVTYDNKRYDASVLAVSPNHDLAMIHIDRFHTPFFRLAASVARGEQIFVLGSPLGITDTLSTGIVARLDGDLTLIDCSALPGNSGGPVFNKDKEMVGVLTAGFIVLFGTTHLNITQSRDAVEFFLIKTYGVRSNGY